METDRIMQLIMSMQQDIATLTEQNKAAFKRIDEQKELTQSVSKLASSVEVMAHEQARMREEQTRTRTDLDALRLKPAARWESVVGQLVSLIVAAAAGGMIAKIF